MNCSFNCSNKDVCMTVLMCTSNLQFHLYLEGFLSIVMAAAQVDEHGICGRSHICFILSFKLQSSLQFLMRNIKLWKTNCKHVFTSTDEWFWMVTSDRPTSTIYYNVEPSYFLWMCGNPLATIGNKLAE